IEGAFLEDGKGLSKWDAFSHTKGKPSKNIIEEINQMDIDWTLITSDHFKGRHYNHAKNNNKILITRWLPDHTASYYCSSLSSAQPLQKLGSCPSNNKPNSTFGLGYDSISDDYKIFKIDSIGGDDSRPPSKILALKSGSWRKIDNHPRIFHNSTYRDDPLAFVFGAFHWLCKDNIEGGYIEDGKSLSNWDVYSHTNGSIKYGGNGDIADDHYHRYLEDIDIMESLGVNAYRFSISWSRVLPNGSSGPMNPAGIKFYNNIIDNLLLKGITPFVTIHHNDYPQELEERYGAWLSPFMQEEFVHFASTCFKNFGNRVKYWATINEPNLFSELAYMKGIFPPVHCSPPFGKCSCGNSDIEPLLVVHNSILAHAKAVKIYRDQFQVEQHGMIGMVASAYMYKPMTDDEVDKKAATRALTFHVAWYMGMPGLYVVPQGMEDIIDYIKKRYNNMPIFVTENGYGSNDNQEGGYDLDKDINRIKFHKAYLTSLVRSIRNGADVRGYFIWSLMDNLEWNFGYTIKFGLYYVDPLTLDRSPKLSAHWYHNFLTNNRQAKKSI
ncbi:hypothetical protein MTR67_033131, partial [Solanum verrucosum]